MAGRPFLIAAVASPPSLGSAYLPPFAPRDLGHYAARTVRLKQPRSNTGSLRALLHRDWEAAGLTPDDFGRRPSSFFYTKHLPVNDLKLNGTFVRDLARERVNRTLVDKTNDIDQVPGGETVFECAEDANIIRFLTELGVD